MKTQKETAKASNVSLAKYRKMLDKYIVVSGYSGVPRFMIFGTGIFKQYPSVVQIKKRIKRFKKEEN